MITACSHVAGVSGVPKQPQLDTEPWRSRMTTTNPAKTAYETATSAANTGTGQMMAAVPSPNSPAASSGTVRARKRG